MESRNTSFAKNNLTINVIYDLRHNEDYDRLREEFKKQKIEHFKFWSAIVLTHSVVESISESFKMIIRDAKEKKLPIVCIAEQDLMFTSETSWEYFLKNIPKEFDVYIGGNYLYDNRIEYKEPLVKVPTWVGNHLIIVHERYYDTWLETDSKKHCDSEQNELGEFYCCFPYVALQRSGYSANSQSEVNYNSIFNAEIMKGFIYQ